MKNIVAFHAQSRLLVKLICCIAFAFASSACCLLKFIDMVLESNVYSIKYLTENLLVIELR